MTIVLTTNGSILYLHRVEPIMHRNSKRKRSNSNSDSEEDDEELTEMLMEELLGEPAKAPTSVDMGKYFCLL